MLGLARLGLVLGLCLLGLCDAFLCFGLLTGQGGLGGGLFLLDALSLQRGVLVALLDGRDEPMKVLCSRGSARLLGRMVEGLTWDLLRSLLSNSCLVCRSASVRRRSMSARRVPR